MNWRWKARVQNLIAALPGSDGVYYAVQRSVGSLRPGRHDPRDWLAAAARMARWFEEAGREVEGARALEVGTGRTVDLPLGLWLCGAGSVTTVDLNTYLSAALVRESIDFMRRNEREVRSIFEGRGPVFEERLKVLLDFDGTLDELLGLANIEYRGGADAARLDAPDRSFDFHVSHAVLEHIPPEVVAAILGEARRLLAPGGLVAHVIDPSDHFSHDDPSITAINFLRYSDGEWHRLAGNKFTYHNRLRAHEFVELFERAGVRLLKRAEWVDEPSLRELRAGFPLDSRFRTVEPEKLAVRSINLLGGFDRDVNGEGAASAARKAEGAD